jgi:hypothetical protein
MILGKQTVFDDKGLKLLVYRKLGIQDCNLIGKEKECF